MIFQSVFERFKFINKYLIHHLFLFFSSVSDRETWDTPYRWREAKTESRDSDYEKCSEDDLVNMDYQRDPEEPMTELPESDKNEEKQLAEEKKYQKTLHVDRNVIRSVSNK